MNDKKHPDNKAVGSAYIQSKVLNAKEKIEYEVLCIITYKIISCEILMSTRPDPEQNLKGGAKFPGVCTFSTH